ncbi:MAG: hypothetical protein JNM67_02900, partial [Bacteroidetes bacterium]|nr:hypothetical protein [Bacteroidota bacterium]
MVHGSFRLFIDNRVLTDSFQVNESESYVLVHPALIGKQAIIYYRAFQFGANKLYFHKPLYIIEPVLSAVPRYMYKYETNKTGIERVFGENINANGNISRGLGFGNTQDVVVNSTMNIQLNGKLDNKIKLMAALSDDNNPLQPEGNTQQIQDFDKVFITLYSDSGALTVGDFLMKTESHNYFMKYYKKSRGLQADLKLGDGFLNHLHADVAVSRGRFVRNEIQGLEGNQGPYRLQGSNGELNIIVISGTEMVYIDGEKMERGQQNDYVIDYNTGEITFMPRRLITKFNRIVVEFQYSDRNYSRSVFTFSNQYVKGGFSAAVNYFSEQDNKQQPTDTSNASSIQDILAASGDAPAFFNYERQYRSYQFDRVNYRKIDSLGNDILVFTNDPNSDSVFYTATFSLVGDNKGDYILTASSANGRVYAWVAPVNGVPQGNYVPFVSLVAPQRQQMLTVSSAYSGKKWQANVEAAYSNNNINTYSNINKSNDDGLGFFVNLANNAAQLGPFKINSSFRSEFISSNFKFVERYRPVEFNRIWNRQLSNTNVQNVASPEWISAFKTNWQSTHHHFNLELGNFTRSSFFQGYRAIGGYRFSNKKMDITYNQEWMNTESKSNIVRNNLINNKRFESVFKFKYVKLGLSAATEESRFSNDTSSSLEAISYRFNSIGTFLQSQLSKHWNYKLDVNYRADDAVNGQNFAYASTGVNASGNLEHLGKGLNRLNIVGSYRKLNLANSDDDEDVILGRIEYNANFFKRAINSGTYYQIGTGREQ